MTSLYQTTRRHVPQNIELSHYDYSREDAARCHKLCSFALTEVFILSKNTSSVVGGLTNIYVCLMTFQFLI
jgi:hypothetical protein